MKIFCFKINNQEELEHHKNYHLIDKDPNNFNLCATREKWQEIEYALSRDRLMFWNSETHKFYDYNFNLITKDLKNDVIFPRVGVGQYQSIANDILMNGWDIISKPYEFNSVEMWPLTIPQEYTKRKLIVVQNKQASENFNYYYDLVKNNEDQFFVKSIRKGFHYAGGRVGWFDTGMSFSLEYGSSEGFALFSEYLKLKEDEEETLEYRCFFINGMLKSISRYLDYKEILIPREIIDYAKMLESKVVRGIILLEANDVCCSGRYISNRVEDFF